MNVCKKMYNKKNTIDLNRGESGESILVSFHRYFFGMKIVIIGATGGTSNE